MAQGFVVTDHIARPPGEVWSYLTDFSSAGKWMPGIAAMSKKTPGPLGVGTAFTFGARGRQHETVITEFSPPQRMALTSIQSGVSATYTYELTPSRGGTDISMSGTCRTQGRLQRLLYPLIHFAMKWADGRQLANLKAAVEAQSNETKPA